MNHKSLEVQNLERKLELCKTELDDAREYVRALESDRNSCILNEIDIDGKLRELEAKLFNAEHKLMLQRNHFSIEQVLKLVIVFLLLGGFIGYLFKAINWTLLN